jgi:MFS family permease
MFEDKKTTWLFYTFVFLFTLHITPAIYINSSYLSQFMSTSAVSLTYGIASLLTIFGILTMRARLKHFGNYKTFMGGLVLEIVALLLLIFSNSVIPAFVSFITLFVAHTLLFINLDIFLERNTPNGNTGTVRGWYLTAINAAFIVGPFLSSIFLAGDDYKQVYIFILFLLFPILFMASELFSEFKDAPYDRIRLVGAYKKLKQNVDIYSTLMSDFILRFFYAWMIIYVPIYLHTYQGFTLSEVTLILSVALIPFIIIQSFAGNLADQKYGEKEMLTLGFVVMAVFTGLISFIQSDNISLWIALLFMTRVGAAMVEIMTETHLFKRIDSSDFSVISLYRIIRPAAIILGTLLGTLFLFIVSFNMLFLILAGIVLYGIRYSLTLKDTR